MEYITIENEKISGHFCGGIKPEEAIEVNNFNGTIGEPVNYYDDKWNRKSDIDLYKEGIKEIPTGFKFNDDKTNIVKMSDIELYTAGIQEIPIGYKLNDDKTSLIELTLDEKLSAGIITKEQYVSSRQSELKELINNLECIQARPLRAIVLGIATDEDKEKLKSIESLIDKYREELQSL